MESFELVPLANGITSLRSLGNFETFHPGIGPAEEARILHVEQQRIVERAQLNQDFSLWDVGLGAAANALAAIRGLQAGLPQGCQTRVVLESFDQTTAPLEFALQNSEALGYVQGFEKEIRELLDTGTVELDHGIRWNFHQGDFCRTLATFQARGPDAIFYDPYSVKCNGAMWTLAHFTRLFEKLDPMIPTLMTSYTNSTYVRVTLLLAGFHVGYGCPIDRKLHTTLASTKLDLLERPLDKDWLYSRVTASHSAAPIREIPYKIAPITEEDFDRLTRLPQFA